MAIVVPVSTQTAGSCAMAAPSTRGTWDPTSPTIASYAAPAIAPLTASMMTGTTNPKTR